MCNKEASFGDYKQQQKRNENATQIQHKCNKNAARQNNQVLEDHKVAGLITSFNKLFRLG